MPQKTNNPEKKQTGNGMTLSSASVRQEQKRAMAGGGIEWLGLEGKEVR